MWLAAGDSFLNPSSNYHQCSLILIQYLHSSSRSSVSSSPSTRCPQSCQHCKWGSSDTFTQDWYFMSKRPSSHRRLIADRPVVGCVIRDFPSILHIWRGCYRRAYSMLEASVVKVSPLEAQPKLISHETRLKLWYVGDTAPESKTGHRNWPFMVLGQIYGLLNLGHKFCQKYRYLQCVSSSISWLLGDDRLSQWSQ